MKSFRRKDGQDEPPVPERNGERTFKGEKRPNETHAPATDPATDPDARLAKKSGGQEAKLGFTGHLLMENRNGLIADARLTHATGTAEPEAALEMLGALPGTGTKTVGAGKNHDTAAFVAASRKLCVTPQVAQTIMAHRGSNIGGRTTRHDGYRISQVIRKRIEEANGWVKEVGGIARTKFRGLARVGWMFTFKAAAYTLIRLPRLVATGSICQRCAPRPCNGLSGTPTMRDSAPGNRKSGYKQGISGSERGFSAAC